MQILGAMKDITLNFTIAIVNLGGQLWNYEISRHDPLYKEQMNQQCSNPRISKRRISGGDKRHTVVEQENIVSGALVLTTLWPIKPGSVARPVTNRKQATCANIEQLPRWQAIDPGLLVLSPPLASTCCSLDSN
jgi:hypothetical protein